MRFAYYTEDNQQGGVPGLATDSPCVGAVDEPLASCIWWSTFRFKFLIVSCCESLIWWRGIFLDFLPFFFYTEYFVLTFSICVVSSRGGGVSIEIYRLTSIGIPFIMEIPYLENGLHIERGSASGILRTVKCRCLTRIRELECFNIMALVLDFHDFDTRQQYCWRRCPLSERLGNS